MTVTKTWAGPMKHFSALPLTDAELAKVKENEVRGEVRKIFLVSTVFGPDDYKGVGLSQEEVEKLRL